MPVPLIKVSIKSELLLIKSNNRPASFPALCVYELPVSHQPFLISVVCVFFPFPPAHASWGQIFTTPAQQAVDQQTPPIMREQSSVTMTGSGNWEATSVQDRRNFHFHPQLFTLENMTHSVRSNNHAHKDTKACRGTIQIELSLLNFFRLLCPYVPTSVESH